MEIREYGPFRAEEILPLYDSVGWTNYTRQPDMLQNAYAHSLLTLGAYTGDKLLGVLRCAGDTKVPFYYGLVSMWGVRLVLAWLLGMVLGFGVAGFWWAMVADLGVRGLLLMRRFRQGKWIHAKV